jgi:pimeloyl-ACP methyl ester carboxylesterase
MSSAVEQCIRTPRGAHLPPVSKGNVMFNLNLPLFLSASATVVNAETSAERIKTIVLVHGAFADGSSWDKVTPLLEAKGYRVIAVHEPLSSLEADVAATRRAIEQAHGPVLLVGHSYGGFVITEAGTNDKVKGLVYIAAFAPDNGESINDVYKGKPAPEWLPEAVVDSAGFAWLPHETVKTKFAQDLGPAEVSLLTAKQGPTALKIFDDHITTAAWRTRPCWFVRPDQDHIIASDLQAAMAKRAGARVTNLPSSHVAMLSHPKEVAAVILSAAAAN